MYISEWAHEGKKDALPKAVHWLSLAAKQGCVAAQFSIGSLHIEKQTPLLQSAEKGLKLLLSAARKGHAESQYKCSFILSDQGKDEDAFIWCTLSAAQGNPNAQQQLCRILVCDHWDIIDYGGFPLLALCRGLFWAKKAALQSITDSQVIMANFLFDLKMQLYDGVPNQVGYSCLPEVFFWGRQVRSSNVAPTKPLLDRGFNETSSLQSCAYCGKAGSRSAAASSGSSSEPVKILHCAGCRSVGYCSQKCQRKHWNLGHKIDCLQVKALKESMKATPGSALFLQNT